MSAKKSRFHGLFETQQHDVATQAVHEQADRGTPTASETVGEIKKPRNQETKSSRNQEDGPGKVPRIKTNYEIREDYVRAVKRIAVDDGRKIYEVLEEAIAQYLDRRTQSNQ